MGRTVNILIADDSAMYRTMTKNSFTQKSRLTANFVEVGSGKDALKKMREMHFDLVVLDWNMPDPKGDVVLETIRSDSKLKDLKVIMVTSEGAKKEVMKVYMKVNDYIVKPINIDKFGEALRKMDLLG